jgi:hypothetical protein
MGISALGPLVPSSSRIGQWVLAADFNEDGRRHDARTVILAGVAWAAGAAGPYLHAKRMLDAAIVPPGSVQAWRGTAWFPVNPQGSASFLRAHAPAGEPEQDRGLVGHGRRPDDPYDVLDAERDNSGGSPADLDFTVATLGAGWPASGLMPRWSPTGPRAPIPEDPHPRGHGQT